MPLSKSPVVTAPPTGGWPLPPVNQLPDPIRRQQQRLHAHPRCALCSICVWQHPHIFELFAVAADNKTHAYRFNTDAARAAIR